jgi:nucleotide-binding universal stress UspA family protein
LHLINIIPLPSHILLTDQGEILDDGDFDTSVPKKQREENALKLEQWKQQYAPGAITCVCFGHVNEQLLDYANKHNAGLIVMGTHPSFGVQELLNSSHGEYAAMHAKMPLLTVKCDRSDLQIKSLVLANSFKSADIPHAEMALALQKAFNAKLYLLRINTPNDFVSDADAERNMKEFASKNQLENVEYCIYNDNDVEDGIVHFVAKHDIDVIAIGSKQRTGLNKIINGCVSADLVNHVMKPILTHPL